MVSSSSTTSREIPIAARKEEESARIECGPGNKKILNEKLRESEALLGS